MAITFTLKQLVDRMDTGRVFLVRQFIKVYAMSSFGTTCMGRLSIHSMFILRRSVATKLYNGPRQEAKAISGSLEVLHLILTPHSRLLCFPTHAIMQSISEDTANN